MGEREGEGGRELGQRRCNRPTPATHLSKGHMTLMTFQTFQSVIEFAV